MKKKKKKKIKVKAVGIIMGGVVILGVLTWNFHLKNKPLEITVVSTIEGYNYYLDSNETRVYKKYYKQLEEEIEDNKIDEKNYAELVAKLFIIDFYTLSNKVTNQDIGGIQFVHTNLQSKLKSEATSSVYKYVKNNLSGQRRQKLPEVKDVEILENKQINYNNEKYQDLSAYQLKVKVEYVKDLDYPEEVSVTLIHEENKLVLVEMK
ncbi:MAG: hypothetical protein PUB18_04420 [bacterium]|nr:hypothetical protein [bacterium]